MFDAQQTEAFILVGGEGKRLGGRDKGLIPINGTPCVRLISQILAQFCCQITLLGPPVTHPDHEQRKNRYVEILKDLPISLRWRSDLDTEHRSGVHRALKGVFHYAEFPWFWIISADLPLLNTQVLKQLTQNLEAQHLAHLFENDGYLQPFIGLWSSTAHIHLEPIWEHSRSLQTLSEADWVKRSQPVIPSALLNLNSPADLELAQRINPSLRFELRKEFRE